jgi:PAS domain S-box-containing protein
MPVGDAGYLVGLLRDLKTVIDHLPCAVYVCDAPGGVIRLYNQCAVELWGREPKLGDTDERFCGSFRLFRPDGSALAHADTPMAEALRGDRPRDQEFVIERPDGSRVRVRVTVAPLRGPAGHIAGMINVFQDISDRTRLEEALRVSEARNLAIVEDDPDLVCRFLPDGTLTFVNDAYCRYFGLRRSDVVGTRYLRLVHPDDRGNIEAVLASVSPANRVVVSQNRVVRADGAIRRTQWTNRALYDGQDRLLELQAVGHDITERTRAEEDAARLAAIVASADDAIISKTLDGVITSWNRAAERIFGYSSEEAVGQPITIIIPPDRREEEVGILGRLKRGEAIEHFETERARKDGRRVAIALTVSPVRDLSGRIVGASKVARDITDNKRAEAALRANVRILEDLYRLADAVGRAQGLPAVCEAAVETIMSVGGAHRASVLVFEEGGGMRFVAWRGLSADYRAAVEGHSPWSADTRDPAPILVEDVLSDPGLGPLRDVVVAEGIRSLAFMPLVYQGRLVGRFMVCYDGPHRFSAEEVRLAATIAHHVAVGVVRAQDEVAIKDLLHREQAARREADAARIEAERASQAKDEFLAMLAHELRNPLGVVVNAIAVAEGASGQEPERARALGVIRRQSEHLARLLDDLLDVARITSGRIVLERQHVDLALTIDQAVESERHRIEGKRQRLILCRGDERVPVVGDPVRLHQIVANLLNNSWKYTPAGGSIWITLGIDGAEAILKVRDDGAGIPPARLESIFDLFVQANPTLARTEGGLGIGLTLVKRLVEMHGGGVRAASEGPGRGAEFVVRLPLARTVEEPAPLPSAPAPAASRRILVIEDNNDGREMLVTMLRLSGHEVLEAATGENGIGMAAQHSPAVVLVDIGLPDVSGYEVGRQLRKMLGGDVRLVALTGYGQAEDRARSQAAGFDAHVLKPIDPRKLTEVL